MNIAIDISPLHSGNFLQHRVRGTGFYIENLKTSLEKYFPENNYIYFIKGDKLQKNTDVIHYTYFEPFFLTLPLEKKHKKIVTVHDVTPLVFPIHFPPGIKGKIKWEIQKKALKNSDIIITDSSSSKRDIIKYTGIKDEKIKVIYLAAKENFVPLKNKNTKQEITKKYNIPSEFILYVGDITWNKNVPRLIEAVNTIEIPLVIVGKALSDKELGKTDRKNLWNQDLFKVEQLIKQNKEIFRLGFVPEEDLIKLYNSARVFLMPSLYEGFGLPVLEAMSCGCPVITSKDGSLEEVGGEAVFYVDAHNTNSIASGVKEVFIDSKKQIELKKKGLVQAKKFSWKKTAEETIKVYEGTN